VLNGTTKQVPLLMFTRRDRFETTTTCRIFVISGGGMTPVKSHMSTVPGLGTKGMLIDARFPQHHGRTRVTNNSS
jgi:hypothetical protein